MSYAMSNRFNISYPIEMKDLERNLKDIDHISLMSIGYCISNTSSEIIEETMNRT